MFPLLSDLLWTSPELLRDTTNTQTGSREGDVYSFGIILHELFYRMGPFSGHGNLTVKGQLLVYSLYFLGSLTYFNVSTYTILGLRSPDLHFLNFLLSVVEQSSANRETCRRTINQCTLYVQYVLEILTNLNKSMSLGGTDFCILVVKYVF